MKQNEANMIEVVGEMLSFTESMTEKANPETHVKAINELHGQSTDYAIIDKQIELINADTSTGIDEKTELVKKMLFLKVELRDKEKERKKQYSELLDNHTEKTFTFIGKLILGIFTGGLSYAPDIYKGIKRQKNTYEPISDDDQNLIA